MNEKTTKPNAEELKLQAKGAVDKLLALATRKYHIDVEIYGWAIGLAVVIFLIIIAI